MTFKGPFQPKLFYDSMIRDYLSRQLDLQEGGMVVLANIIPTIRVWPANPDEDNAEGNSIA